MSNVNCPASIREQVLTEGRRAAKVSNALRIFSDYLHPLISEVEQKEALVKEGANMATMEKIKGTTALSVFSVLRSDEQQGNPESSRT